MELKCVHQELCFIFHTPDQLLDFIIPHNLNQKYRNNVTEKAHESNSTEICTTVLILDCCV